MSMSHETPLRIMALTDPDDFDAVTPADVEACRRGLSLTPPEFAEYLGWSARKYQRVLEAAREDAFVSRDTALAVRGLAHVLLGSDGESTASPSDVGLNLLNEGTAKLFLGGKVFPHILPSIARESGEWTAEVTPHLLRLIAERAVRGKLIKYGEAATTLEERKLTKRVWPRTLYGMPLGAICNALMALGHEGRIRIPLLSVIVVRADGEPGEGLDGMIKKYVRQYETREAAEDVLARIRRDRAALIKEMQDEVFSFGNWPGVLRALDVSV